jgi:hypothetical protein
MSEQDNNTIDNNDVIEELPAIETPIKIKKPVSLEKLEQLKKARLVGAEKKKEMKELKIKAKQLPIEEYKLSAMKYDQLQKQKEDLIKPKEDIIKIKEEIQEEKPKNKDKKKRIIKKIIYEDGSEDEVEDLRHIQPKQIMNPYMSIYNNNQESYSNLVYQSACDKLKEKVQDERTKYLISSLMPNYG